jgi:hypothetical protein
MKVVSYQISIVGKFFLLTIISLSFISLSFAQTSKTSITEQAALVTEFDVNGLKVLVKRRQTAPTVAVGLFIRGGAQNITGKNAGIEILCSMPRLKAAKSFLVKLCAANLLVQEAASVQALAMITAF